MVGAFSDNGGDDSDTSATSDFCLREVACERDRERELLLFGWRTLGQDSSGPATSPLSRGAGNSERLQLACLILLITNALGLRTTIGIRFEITSH